MSNLALIEKNRGLLSSTLNQEISYVKSMIGIDEEDEFKNNFLELAQNNYLMEKIPPKEILYTALNATKLGLNVNPIYKELYVLPFNVSGKGTVASIVISKHGHAQIAYESGFFLDISVVYNLNGTILSEKDMTREQKASIQTTNPTWVDDCLVGWDITLTDISNSEIKVPTQTKFIEAGYAKEVTKQLQEPKYKIQTWTHKAVRRAMGDFFIPKHRRKMILERVEAYNDRNEREDLTTISTTGATESSTVNLKNTVIDVPEEIEAEEVMDITVDTISAYYKQANNDTRAKITGILPQNWRDLPAEDLATLYGEIKAL